MSTSPVLPAEPSTITSIQDPNSITNLIKKTQEQNKQAQSDTVYDTKKGVYESFETKQQGQLKRGFSIAASFALAAGVLLIVGSLLPKKGRV